MNILVCIKRVPDIGAKFDLTDDRRAIVTKNLGFTISPHEECAVEAAIQLIEKEGGKSTVVTLGPEDAEEQLRDSLARGVDEGGLLETGGEEWDPGETAQALVDFVKSRESTGDPFDLIILGSEAADSAGFQVAARMAHALDVPCLTGMKALEIKDGRGEASRETDAGWEIYDFEIPAVVSVKEGINSPRYPSLRGTLKAKKKKIESISPKKAGPKMLMKALEHPPDSGKQVVMLEQGPAAAPQVIEILMNMELL